jgi:S1-C subfamily serine protease
MPIQNGAGTLFSVESGRSWLLTCRHVVETPGRAADARVLVYWLDGRKSSARIEWQGESDVDLAILSAESPASGDAPLPAAVPLGTPMSAQVGEPVFAIGNPLDYDTSLVTGVISAVRTIGAEATPVRIFQAQIPLNPGNSGGGLYTHEGKLIGVNSWTLPKGAAEGMGFAISIENLSAAVANGPAPLAAALRHAIPAPPPEAGR